MPTDLELEDEASHPETPKILIVDDTEFSRFILAGLLTKLGLESDHVWDGEEAIAKIRSRDAAHNPYVLIIMDVEMPVCNGWDTTAKLRKLE